MDTRDAVEYKIPDLNEGSSSHPIENNSSNPEQQGKLSGISANFEVIAATGDESNTESDDDMPSPPERILKLSSINETDIILNFVLNYDDNKTHQDFIEQFFQNDNGYVTGILSEWSRHEKFDIKDFNHWLSSDKFTDDTINDKKVLKISFKIDRLDVNYLLQLLSIINDAINALNKNAIDIKFNLLDITKSISNVYKQLNVDDSKCAIVLNQLIGMITHNSEVNPDDAILLLYCFTAMHISDHSLSCTPNNISLLSSEVIKIIDKTFSINFIKPENETLSNDKDNVQINKDCKQDLNEFMRRLNLCQRIKLYRPSIGILADDGGLYRWHYTEWYFLRDSKFTFNKSKNVHVNLNTDVKPKAYLKHYAKGKENHNIFPRELTSLGPHIGLAFNPDIKWHEEITFMPDCANRLFQMNLHFDGESIKTILKARNNNLFFEQATKTGYLMAALPKEVIKIIYTLAYGPLLATAELDSSNHQSYALRY